MQSAIHYTDAQSISSLLVLAAAAFFVSYHYAIPNRQEAHPYYLTGMGALILTASLHLADVWITVAWGLIAFISLVLGLKTNRDVPRTAGLILLIITVAKLFVIDTTNLSPGLRIIAYIALGIILLVGSMAYRKYLRD